MRQPPRHLNNTQLLLTLGGFLLFAKAAGAQVGWQIAPDKDRPPVMTADQVRQQLTDHAPAGSASHVVVRLARPVTDAARAELSKVGVTILAPLGDTSFFASIDAARLDAVAAGASGWIDNVRAIDTLWKLHPAIVQDRPMPWAQVAIPPAAPPNADANPHANNNAPILMDAARAGDRAGLAVYLQLHEDVPTDAAAVALVESFGGIVRFTFGDARLIVAEIPKADLFTLASDDRVQWIEPAMPQFSTQNAENRVLTQANAVQASPYNLNGAGVKVFVYDAGSVLTTHNDLTGRVTVLDGSGVVSHSTHVAGTVGGTGAASAGNNRGMAPGVTILSAGFTVSGTAWLYTNPSDLVGDYTTAFSSGAQIATNSIGTNTASNGFDCTWEGNYGAVAGIIDQIARGDSPSVTGGAPLRIVWAAGNERGSGRCGNQYGTTAPPANAKNSMVIGAVNSNDDSMTSFSSWGPDDSGRMRPDFSAPGCQVGGDNGVTSTDSSSNTAYVSLCGTSMATPTVTGCSALIMQDWRVQRPGLPDPRNSTLKVLFAHTAVDRGNPGPDNQFGYGSIRVKDAIDQMRTGRVVEDTVFQGAAVAYNVPVPSGSPQAKFTLAWDDPSSTANVTAAIVNNLDLVVIDPNGVRQFPWTLNPASPAANAVQTAENTLDNIEQVLVNNPVGGIWTVQVRGTSVPVGPQPFSITATHDLNPGTPVPSINISAAVLAPALVDRATPATVACNVLINSDTLADNSVKAVYRLSPSGAWSNVILANVGGTRWQGQIPGLPCGSAPEYYFSATGVAAGTVTTTGPNFTYAIGADVPFLADDFETDRGWVGGQPGDTAVTGRWIRMAPQQTVNGSIIVQPGSDHTAAPGTQCWVTDGNAGAAVGTFDIDGGFTTLLSAPIDLTGKPAATISYWRWYSNNSNGAAPDDVFTVQISNDGVAWTTVETVGPGATSGGENSGSWIQHAFTVGSFLPTPSANVRLRFIASDLGAGGIVEALVDDLVITNRECHNPTCPCVADFDGSDGAPDTTDISAYFNAWLAGDPRADADCSGGAPNATDITAFFTQWLAGGC